jgi:aminopeptidase N
MKNLISFIAITLSVSGLTFSLYAQEGLNGDEKRVFTMQKLDADALKFSPFQAGANYDVKWYRCWWNIDPAVRAISGNVTTLFSPVGQGLDSVSFELHQAMTVDSVLYHNNPVSWVHNSNIVTIGFTSTIPLQTLDSVTIYYHGIPPGINSGAFIRTVNGERRTPFIYTFSLLGHASDWWPCKTALTDKADSIDIFINTPLGYNTATVGLLVSEVNDEVNTVYHWKHRYPIANYAINIAVTRYTRYTQKVPYEKDTLEIVNYFFPDEADDLARRSNILGPAIMLFDSLFGLYPFQNEKYGQAQFSASAGMENQTMSFISNFSYNVMTHELAHQWFGNKITCGSWSDVWLNEGFAVFLTDLCYEHYHYNMLKSRIQGHIDLITSEPGGSVYCPDTLDWGRVFDHRLSYEKGAMILQQLRWIIGDSAFFAALKNYITDERLAYGFARTTDLKSHLENSSGQDLTWYFDDWFTGQGYPIYSMNIVQNQDDSAIITINQSQSHSSVSFFEMPVPIQFFGTDRDTTIIFYNTFSGQTFEINPNFAITSTKFDPDLRLIKKYNPILVGLDNLSATKILKIYPNPVKDKFIITSSALTGNSTLSIYNSDGHKVMERLIAESKTEIDVSNLLKGLYLLKLENGQSIETGKIVKE